jgi:site-specific recombinase XerD
MKMDFQPTDDGTMELATVKADSPALLSDDLSTERKVENFLTRLLPARRSAKTNPAAALVPWVCDRLPSRHSREAYGRDLAAFVLHMRKQRIDPLHVTGDDLRIYKAALLEAGRSATTVGRVLSVLRGTYEQFGIHGLVDWDRVRDIQAVTSPRVEKNTTPVLSEVEAKKLLHAPDRSTLGGLRDHAMLFAFFKTASRCSALANAKVGHIERTDTNYYLMVLEKGKKRQRKALLEAAPAIMAYMEAAGIAEDRTGPLFRPVAKDRRTLLNKGMDRRTIWKTVKKYARQAGIDVDRLGGRGVGVHSLRKTAITNALEHGAKMEQVQQLAGHADIRTTQLYFQPKERDAEDAARHIQIR